MASFITKMFKKNDEPLSVNLQPANISFDVRPNSLLLQEALEAGIAFPHDCRVGTCGSCKCRLIDGKVKPVFDFSYTLSREDVEKGYILACQAMIKSNITVEVDGQIQEANHKIKSIDGTIVSALPLTNDIVKIQVDLEGKITYEAGQYADVSVSCIEEPRSYSFADAPNQLGTSLVSFFIRHVPNGEMSSWFHEKSRIGEKLTITGPYGQFYLRKSSDPIICIAGGSGLAPIKAILEEAYNQGGNTPVVFLFGARTQDDLYCLDEINEFVSSWKAPFYFIPVLSQEPIESNWKGARGLVTEYIEDQQDILLSSSTAYLCGPPAMIDASINKLNECGITDEYIFFDKFLDRSHTVAK
jgi:NAD(P)H-flavin reductase/ferredoxin